LIRFVARAAVLASLACVPGGGELPRAGDAPVDVPTASKDLAVQTVGPDVALRLARTPLGAPVAAPSPVLVARPRFDRMPPAIDRLHRPLHRMPRARALEPPSLRA